MTASIILFKNIQAYFLLQLKLISVNEVFFFFFFFVSCQHLFWTVNYNWNLCSKSTEETLSKLRQDRGIEKGKWAEKLDILDQTEESIFYPIFRIAITELFPLWSFCFFYFFPVFNHIFNTNHRIILQKHFVSLSGFIQLINVNKRITESKYCKK